MSTDNNNITWRDTVQWEYEGARRREKIFKQTLERFAQDKEVQEYLQEFQPSSVQSVLESYAWQKAKWLVDKPGSEWCLEYTALKTPLEAQDCLGNIQQKKLFDKQCLWRAEMFTHPAIETTADFNYWERNILNCPFIDPITEDDIELYIEFLKEYLGENLTFLGSWQDYNTYNSAHATVSKMMQQPPEEKEEEDNEAYDEEDKDENNLMPPWYTFVNQRRGDGHYLLQPDKRQEKEWFYSRKANAEQTELAKERFKLNPPDTRPYLQLFKREDIEMFINDYEENADEILSAYDIHQKLYNSPEEEKMYWVNEAWEELKDCTEPFEIAAGVTDWKEALIKTARQWTNTKLVRMLPFYYDEYLFRRGSGIANTCDEEQVATYRRMADDYKKTILRGRELSGEPADLNF
jgi:hypothetical protein